VFLRVVWPVTNFLLLVQSNIVFLYGEFFSIFLAESYTIVARSHFSLIPAAPPCLIPVRMRTLLQEVGTLAPTF
jgi:hypothetical protein